MAGLHYFAYRSVFWQIGERSLGFAQGRGLAMNPKRALPGNQFKPDQRNSVAPQE